MTIVIILGILSFGLGWLLTRWLVRKPPSMGRIQDLGDGIVQTNSIEGVAPKVSLPPLTKDEIAEERRIADEFLRDSKTKQ